MEKIKSLVVIGKIVRVHGLHGTIRIKSLSDIAGRFSELKSFFIGSSETETSEIQIDRISEVNGMITAQLDGIKTRDDAEHLVGQFIFIDEKDMQPAPEGKFFIHDLIGMKVISDDGKYSGIIKDVMNLPANDVYSVDVNGKEVLIPAVPDFIERVDTVKKLITVHNVPGLFEDVNEN